MILKKIKLYRSVNALLNTLEYLRSDKGCEWDRAQTPYSLRKYLIEEAAELIEAIEERERDHLKEEYGDVLLVILLMMYSKHATHSFSLSEICNALHKKLIRRHPHLFGSRPKKRTSLTSLNDTNTNPIWEAIKKSESQDSQDIL